MIPEIDIRADMRSIQARLGYVGKGLQPAAVRALNKTMTTIKADAARSLQKDYPGLKIAKIKSRLPIKKATSAVSTAVLTFNGARIPLYGNFGMRVTKASRGKKGAGRRGAGLRGGFGVSFSKLPWRIETPEGKTVSSEMLARAFRNRLRQGGRATVFAREGAERMPISVLLAPGLARTAVEHRILQATADAGRARFGVVFAQELRFLISKGA